MHVFRNDRKAFTSVAPVWSLESVSMSAAAGTTKGQEANVCHLVASLLNRTVCEQLRSHSQLATQTCGSKANMSPA